MDEHQANLGEQLRQFRLRAGLSQADLAERAGLSTAAVATLERGVRHAPYPRTLAALAAALGLSPEERALLAQAAHATSAPPTTLPGDRTTRASNLPLQRTALIGRERDLEHIRGLVFGSATAYRLVTLTGTGGVGKTSLALATANQLREAYADRVWFVSLAPLVDPELLPHTVAAAVGVPERGDAPLQASVIAALGDQRALLVLDNCEHLIQACAELADALLLGCPGLTILATSREPLGIGGEVTWRVPSLGLPTPPPPPPEQLSQYEAVRLFIERAVAMRPDFQVTAATAPAIAQVCWRLDGIPLAIELAAVWVRTLTVEQLAARLDDCFRLLIGGSRTAPARHRTLRGTIEWSYGLLTEPERRLFARLAVFAGGWSLEAAEVVCADEPSVHQTAPTDGKQVGIASEDVLGLLAQLVDKSLVVMEETGDGAARYRLLETLRLYAREQAGAELPALERRHRDWYLALAESVPPELMDPHHVAQLAHEYDNLRAALRWTIAHGEAEPGLRLGVALWSLWYVRGWYTEGRAWLDELLELSRAAPPTAARARALTWAGHLAFCVGSYATAQASFEEALAVARGLGSEQETTVALVFMALLPRTRGDLAQAEQLYERALAIARRLGQPVWQFFVLDNLALVAERRGDAAATQALGAEALTLAQAVGHQPGVAGMLSLLGRAALDRGDASRARRLLEESAALQRALGFSQGLSWSLSALGLVALAEGDPPRAARLLDEAFALARDTGERLMLVRALDGIASLVAPSQPERAVRLTAAGAALHQALGAEPLPSERVRVERLQATTRRALGQAAYAEAWAAGWERSLDETIGDALRAAEAEAEAEAARAPRSAREHPVARRPARSVRLHDHAPC